MIIVWILTESLKWLNDTNYESGGWEIIKSLSLGMMF
jgi:hypothetical protein